MVIVRAGRKSIPAKQRALISTMIPVRERVPILPLVLRSPTHHQHGKFLGFYPVEEAVWPVLEGVALFILCDPMRVSVHQGWSCPPACGAQMR